jgi:putative copper resistance protein D
VTLDRALLDWPITLAATVIFGTALFLLILPVAEDSGDLAAMADSLLPLWRILSVATVVVSPLALVNITAEMATVSWRAALPLLPEVLTETHAGRVWQCVLPAASLLLLAAFVPARQTVRTVVLFVLAAVLLFLRAMLSHAIDHGAVAVAVYVVHEAAAGLWIGALLTLWIAARRTNLRDLSIERAARRVSLAAFWSVFAIVLSGLYTACNGLGLSARHLLFSTYGRTLIAKVAVFTAVLAIGGFNRYRLMPRITDSTARDALLRNVGLESAILMFVVLGLATLLANTPPPHGAAVLGGHSMMVMFLGDRSKRRSLRPG